jgi:transcriptional regulator with XRE-family HTH domain
MPGMDVKGIRAQLGWTQAALAGTLGVSVITIKKWEAGDRIPSPALAARLAALAAGARPADAIERARPKPRKRRVLRLRDAVAGMGLATGGHGHVSDRTLRNAIKRGALRAWKTAGYRLPEWCFYEDDFDHWRATQYHAHRDPRRDPRG